MKNGGPCLGHSGITKRSRGRSHSSRVYRFRIPRVHPRLAVHMHVCGLVRRQEIADISVALWAEIFSAHGGVRNAKRFLPIAGPVATRRMHVCISSNHPREAIILSQQSRLLESKNEVAKATNLAKPLLCLRPCLRSSNELRPEPRGGWWASMQKRSKNNATRAPGHPNCIIFRFCFLPVRGGWRSCAFAAPQVGSTHLVPTARTQTH
jgi:hypothetical protein